MSSDVKSRRKLWLGLTVVALVFVAVGALAAVQWRTWFPSTPKLAPADLDAWIAQLDDEDEEARWVAMEQLASWGEQAKPAVPTLKSMTRYENNALETAAVARMCLYNIDPDNKEAYEREYENQGLKRLRGQLTTNVKGLMESLDALHRAERLRAGQFPARVRPMPRTAVPPAPGPDAVAAVVEKARAGSLDERIDAAGWLARYGPHLKEHAPLIRQLMEEADTDCQREVDAPRLEVYSIRVKQHRLYRNLARALRRADPDVAREAGVR